MAALKQNKCFILLIVLVFCLFACSGTSDIPAETIPEDTVQEQNSETITNSDEQTNNNDQNTGSEPQGDASQGEISFNSLCSRCHSSTKIGINYPSSDKLNFETLSSYIKQNMPFGNASSCIESCADNISQYILDTYNRIQTTAKSINPFDGAFVFNEAEILTATVGYADKNAWVLNQKGYVNTWVEFTETGHYTFAVRAWPGANSQNMTMLIELDDELLGHFFIDADKSAAGIYAVEILIKDLGLKEFKVWLAAKTSPQDSLWIDWLMVRNPSQVIASL